MCWCTASSLDTLKISISQNHNTGATITFCTTSTHGAIFDSFSLTTNCRTFILQHFANYKQSESVSSALRKVSFVTGNVRTSASFSAVAMYSKSAVSSCTFGLIKNRRTSMCFARVDGGCSPVAQSMVHASSDQIGTASRDLHPASVIIWQIQITSLAASVSA